MKLNTAEVLYRSFVEGLNMLRDYKAPHANRPTPPRKHYPARSRIRLFKGHRK